MAENKTVSAGAPPTVRNLYEKDQEVLRKTFFDNEGLLRAMSKVMFGVALSEPEKGMLRTTFADDEVFYVVKRRFLPSLDDPMSLAQAKDAWSGIELDIAGKPRDVVEQLVGYKARLIAMTEQAVVLLRNPEDPAVDLSVDARLINDPLGTKVLARAQYIVNVNQQISFLWIAGNQKKEEAPASTAAAKANKANPSGKPGMPGKK